MTIYEHGIFIYLVFYCLWLKVHHLYMKVLTLFVTFILKYITFWYWCNYEKKYFDTILTLIERLQKLLRNFFSPQSRETELPPIPKHINSYFLCTRTFSHRTIIPSKPSNSGNLHYSITIEVSGIINKNAVVLL